MPKKSVFSSKAFWFFGVLILFILLYWSPVPTPPEWQGVKVYVNPLRGARIVNKAGDILFVCNIDDGQVSIESIRELPDGRIEAVFRGSTRETGK